jgi:esterase/lipase superfamily enzyme
MKREYHRWFSHRLNRDMGLVVYGHWGPPLMAFPTSGGDEWEMENQGMVGALADYIDGGRVKVFAVGTVASESFYNKRAHPAHRSYVQKQFDAYVRQEVVPFIEVSCQTPGIGISTMGASLGAYYAANTLFKYPDIIKRCFAMSGVYDMRSFMDGYYDDNFYFNNPVDYMANISDAWSLGHLASCDIHLATGHGPWENSGPTYAMSHVLSSRGIRHNVDNWGEKGGHDWPYWKHQMREYLRSS